MRNPNGFGSVYKLAGKRRNPFVAKKTTGWDDEGKQIRQTVGYYPTRAAALQALADYNSSPYDLAGASLTFAEIYEKFSAVKFEKATQPTINGYRQGYKLASELHDMKFVDIRKAHMQAVIDNCGLSHGTRRKIKVLFNQIFKFALENDIVKKDYSQFVTAGENNTESNRKPFSAVEIQRLWDSLSLYDYVDTVLIMIYTGLRPGELVLIKTADVHLDERYMRGGIKTRAGKNRIVPIHKKILPLVAARLEAGHEYLITDRKGKNMSYFIYYDRFFRKVMEQVGMSHKPHDCRHTFATLIDNAGANKVSIKKIMGHASQDITDQVYIHKGLEELLRAVDLI